MLVNPRVGRGLTPVATLLRQLLPPECRVETVEGVPVMTRRIVEAASQGYERVGVAGGDGTVGVLFRTLVELRRRPLAGILPFGTYNNFASSVGIPMEPAEACRAFSEGRPTFIDLGRVISRHPAATFVFKEMVGAGVDATAFSASPDVAGPAKIPMGFIATLGAFLSFRARSIHFRCNGHGTWYRCNQVLVGNTPRYCASFEVLPEARVDDGSLDVLARIWQGRLDMLRELPAILRGRHHELEHDLYRRAERVEIRGNRRVLLHADGEFFCRLPATVEVLPRVLQVMVPAR